MSSTIFYRSLSKLDTGCRGLCVLEERNQDDCQTSKTEMQLTQTFTALVHGFVPDAGINIVLATDGIRRWKKKQENGTEKRTATAGTLVACVRCIERSWNTPCENPASHVPALSTLTITITTTKELFCSGIAQILTHHLRKHVSPGYPVVGDRFASTTEYLLLPRAIRNRIKHRLCMGCTKVTMIVLGEKATSGREQEPRNKVFHTEVPMPERWSAHYWRGFCLNSLAIT
jgi:hypothetical protein